MKIEIETSTWLNNSGITFLKGIGIKRGQDVLDFGARIGSYSIPLAKIVSSQGRVYALDIDTIALEELKKRAFEQKLSNITTLHGRDDLRIMLDDGSLDAVLVYDVLHLIDDRPGLYKEIHRVTKNGGLFSVYPKHNKLDSPGWGLENMTPEDIKKEIESHNFQFKKEHCGMLSHYGILNKGCVLNFEVI